MSRYLLLLKNKYCLRKNEQILKLNFKTTLNK